MGTIISVGFTVFIIFFLVHMLACFFYLIGTGEEEFPVTDDTIMIKGWVHQEDLWCVPTSTCLYKTARADFSCCVVCCSAPLFISFTDYMDGWSPAGSQ